MPNFASTWEPTQTLAGRTNWWLLLVVFALAALVRLSVASGSGLWADEVFSLAMATGHSLEHSAAIAQPLLGDFIEPDRPVPTEEFRRYLKHDNPPASPARVIRATFLSDTSPPLYYLLLYAWTLIFGTSDIVLRLFSITCSLACLPLLADVARRTGGERAVFASCALFAFSPLAIYYSTEGRMYSLLWLCVLATTWSSLLLQERGDRIGIYAFWIAASAAGFLTHYFFLFPWLAIVAYLLIRPEKFVRRNLAACLLLTAILILPWYLKLPESLVSWRITKDWLKWQPKGFDRIVASREAVIQFFSGGGGQDLWVANRESNIVSLILFGVIAVVMVWRLRIHVFGRNRLLLWLLFAAACGGPFVFDLVQHTYTIAKSRYVMAALPGAYLLAAMGLACLGRRTRLVMLVLMVLAWAPNVLSIYRNRFPWLPMREIASAASVDASPSDLILVHSIPSGVLSIARYAKGSSVMASWVGQLGTRRVPESLRALAAGHTRIIFVKVHAVGEPAPEERWLRVKAVVSNERRLGSGSVVDFRLEDGKTF
jgi:hypothetical protein